MSIMRIFPVIFALCVAFIFVGCSRPSRVTVVNNSGGPLTIEIKNEKKWIIGPGQSAELVFNAFFIEAAVTHDGEKRVFGWKYPPRELMDSRRYPAKFTFCLESDGKIYAADASASDGGRHPVQPQPEGFPLVGTP